MRSGGKSSETADRSPLASRQSQVGSRSTSTRAGGRPSAWAKKAVFTVRRLESRGQRGPTPPPACPDVARTRTSFRKLFAISKQLNPDDHTDRLCLGSVNDNFLQYIHRDKNCFPRLRQTWHAACSTLKHERQSPHTFTQTHTS